MPRLLGVDIPNDKIVEISLTYIYGVGRKTALDICEKLDLKLGMRAKDLTEAELKQIASILENDYVIEGQLRRQINQNVIRLKKIGCYRGIRHGRGLPVNGQRTRTNARTRKGRKKTVAGKKSVKAMR